MSRQWINEESLMDGRSSHPEYGFSYVPTNELLELSGVSRVQAELEKKVNTLLNKRDNLIGLLEKFNNRPRREGLKKNQSQLISSINGLIGRLNKADRSANAPSQSQQATKALGDGRSAKHNMLKTSSGKAVLNAKRQERIDTLKTAIQISKLNEERLGNIQYNMIRGMVHDETMAERADSAASASDARDGDIDSALDRAVSVITSTRDAAAIANRAAFGTLATRTANDGSSAQSRFLYDQYSGYQSRATPFRISDYNKRPYDFIDAGADLAPRVVTTKR